jgi:ribosomal protein S18 acetylase RimI-like enzyme
VGEASRIQSYLRETARGSLEPVAVPPFTAFFHPNDPLRYFNYAIPDEPVGGDLVAPLAALRVAFLDRDRLPRLEYVAEFAPGLAAALDEVGFEVELDTPLMTCPAERIAEPPAVAGLEIVQAVDDPRTYLTVQRRGFGGDDKPEATDQQVEDWISRRRDGGTSLLGILDGRPVGVSAATPPVDGLSEVTSIAVLAAARRLGVGAAMTAAASRGAAGHGATLLFLSPATDGSRSVYERVGFVPALTTLYYADPE